MKVGGGGRLPLKEPDDCDCDACDEAYVAGGRCAIALSTPGRLFDHGCGSSLPKVAGMLGKVGDGDGAFATGG